MENQEQESAGPPTENQKQELARSLTEKQKQESAGPPTENQRQELAGPLTEKQRQESARPPMGKSLWHWAAESLAFL